MPFSFWCLIFIYIYTHPTFLHYILYRFLTINKSIFSVPGITQKNTYSTRNKTPKTSPNSISVQSETIKHVLLCHTAPPPPKLIDLMFRLGTTITDNTRVEGNNIYQAADVVRGPGARCRRQPRRRHCEQWARTRTTRLTRQYRSRGGEWVNWYDSNRFCRN